MEKRSNSNCSLETIGFVIVLNVTNRSLTITARKHCIDDAMAIFWRPNSNANIAFGGPILVIML